jgi:hypothetical protein
MKIRKFLRLGWVGAIAAAGILGAAYAQENATDPTAGTAADTSRTVQLSPEQMAVETDKILAGMDGAAKNVRKMLSDAREKNDVVKALCLDDKLTQIDVAQRSASERSAALRQAVSRQDQELATHEYTILVVLKDRVQQLTAEANQCIGVEAGYVGSTKVTVDIDPNLPSDDPSEYPENPVITVPPSCESCVD